MLKQRRAADRSQQTTAWKIKRNCSFIRHQAAIRPVSGGGAGVSSCSEILYGCHKHRAQPITFTSLLEIVHMGQYRLYYWRRLRSKLEKFIQIIFEEPHWFFSVRLTGRLWSAPDVHTRKMKRCSDGCCCVLQLQGSLLVNRSPHYHSDPGSTPQWLLCERSTWLSSATSFFPNTEVCCSKHWAARWERRARPDSGRCPH